MTVTDEFICHDVAARLAELSNEELADWLEDFVRGECMFRSDEKPVAFREIAKRLRQPSAATERVMTSAEAGEVAELRTRCDNFMNIINAKQAKIDALMLEFCPGEMSAEQKANWAANQRALLQGNECKTECATCGGNPRGVLIDLVSGKPVQPLERTYGASWQPCPYCTGRSLALRKASIIEAQALDDAKKLLALPPYNTSSNTTAGDGYFAKACERKYGVEIFEAALKAAKGEA